MKKELEYLAVAEYHSNELRIALLEHLINQHKMEMKQSPSEERFELAYRDSLQDRLTYHSRRSDELYRKAGSLVNHINRKKHWFRKSRAFVLQAWTGLKQKITRCFCRIKRFFQRKHA